MIHTYTYVYDLNGNLTSKLPKADAPAGTPEWAYEYDALDQLITVIRDSLPVERYRYDAFGRRTQIATANGTGGFDRLGIINDGSDRTIDVVNDNGAGNSEARPVRRYTHGGNFDEPLQVETFDASGTFDARYTYHADHLGSIRFLTDALGQVVNAYDYDSYGRVAAELAAFEQPFRFTGREWDTAAQLYHYRARNYDPSTGRFIQEDPIGFAAGDLNISRYVWNNPLNYTDPSGLSAITFAGQSDDSTKRGLTVGHGAAAIIGCLFSRAATAISAAGNDEIKDLLCVIVGTSSSEPARPTVQQKSNTRSIPIPPTPKRGCTAICRADANDNIPGNITEGDLTFAFGQATANTCGEAKKRAKRIATHNLGKQPKHIGCRTTRR